MGPFRYSHLAKLEAFTFLIFTVASSSIAHRLTNHGRHCWTMKEWGWNDLIASKLLWKKFEVSRKCLLESALWHHSPDLSNRPKRLAQRARLICRGCFSNHSAFYTLQISIPSTSTSVIVYCDLQSIILLFLLDQNSIRTMHRILLNPPDTIHTFVRQLVFCAQL